MTFLRSLLFNLAFFAWTALIMLLLLPTLAWQRGALFTSRAWGRGVVDVLCPLIGLRYRILGKEHIPQGAAIIACKHQSTWETLVFFNLLRRPHYVIKVELTRIPLFGQFTQRAGSIVVDRDAGLAAIKGLVRDAKAAIAKGGQVIIFPQGTRIAPGTKEPYQPGIAGLYTQLGVPVVPVALNSGVFWGRRQFEKRQGTVTLEFLPPIPPGLGRARFMAELESRIETASDRLYREAQAEV